MLLRLFLLALTISLVTGYEAKAQLNNGCIDSLLISNKWCDPDYDPVCGCNGLTYRNLCFANNDGVINYADGICEPIAIDFNPNPVSDVIFVDIVLKLEGGVNFWIYDYKGNEFYFQSWARAKELSFNLNVNSFPPGVYLLMAQTDQGDYTFGKMVKYNR